MLHSIDILTYQYADNPNGYPNAYPAVLQENKEYTPLQPNWIRFQTVEEYQNYLQEYQAAFESVINASNKIKQQDVMWERIKNYRDFREEGGVDLTIEGTVYWFHSDVKSLIKYMFLLFLATVFAAQYPGILKWKTMSGSEVVLSKEQVIQMFFRVLYIGQVVFELGRQHREAKLLVDNPYDYDFTAGWPPIFGE